jgi:AcrR family transcriptional regulator
MNVFWEKGYSGTSLSDLTQAMGINKPSLYAAYGNKEELFVSAIESYVSTHGAPHFEKLLMPKLDYQGRLKAYLESIARMITDAKSPRGCFVATSTCEAASSCLPEQAVAAIFEVNSTTIAGLTDFFRKEQAQGSATSAHPPELLADHLLTLQFGLAVMARNGSSLNRLKKVISHAIDSF